VAQSTVQPRSDGIYHVTYLPLEVGEYSVIVRWNGREVQGLQLITKFFKNVLSSSCIIIVVKGSN